MIPYIDFHCDTLMMFALPPKDGSEPNLYENHRMLDLKRMKEGGTAAEFFATFMPPKRFMGEVMSDEMYREALYNGLMDAVQRHGDILAFARGVKDYEKNKKAGKMSAFLTFEDGRMVQGSFDNLQKFYDLGYRLITLTWNFENCFGFPNAKDPLEMEKGLKPFGKEAVSWMMEKGIITDVSHLSDGGFWDVAAISRSTKVPFIASHSCARSLTPHTRNLTDPMLKELGECGGFVGVNFAPEFVGETTDCKISTVKRICDHVEHMANLAGIEAVGIGSDFDGIGGELEVGQPTDMVKLFDELTRRGWSSKDVDKFAYLNAERVLKDTLH